MKTALPFVIVLLATIATAIVTAQLPAGSGSAQAIVGNQFQNYYFRIATPPARPAPPAFVFPESMASPRNLRIASRTGNRLKLAWTPVEAADGRTVVRYEILRNGVRAGASAVAEAEVAFDSLGVEIEWFSVRAVSDSGLASLPCEPVAAPRGEPLPVTRETKIAFGRRHKQGFTGLADPETIFSSAHYQGRIVWTAPDTSVDPGSTAFGAPGTTEITYDYISTMGRETTGTGRIVRTGYFKGQYLDGAVEELPARGQLGISIDSTEVIIVPGAIVMPGIRPPAEGNASGENTHWMYERDDRKPDGTGIYQREEVDLVGEVTNAEIDSGAESDLQQASATIDSLGWNQAYKVSFGLGEYAAQPSPAVAERAFGSDVPHSVQLVSNGVYRFRVGMPSAAPPPPLDPFAPPPPGIPVPLPGPQVQPSLGPSTVTLHWAEVLTPSDGSGPRVLVLRDETVNTVEGEGWTAAYSIPAPSEAGSITTLLLPEFATVLATNTDAALEKIYASDAVLTGMAAEILLVDPAGSQGYLADSAGSSIVRVSDLSIQLIAIDPGVEASQGTAAAINLGEVLGNGSNLSSYITKSGLQFGQWKLMAVGQFPGTASVSVEFAGSALTTIERELTVLPAVSLGVDADRDGLIAAPPVSTSDATSQTRPFRFWVNNDIDRGHKQDGSDWEEDDISPDDALREGWLADWRDNKIANLRDLEDFARLAVQIQNHSTAKFQTGDLYLGLRWSDVHGSPALKLYPQIDPAGDAGYLTNVIAANGQLQAKAIVDARFSDDPASAPEHALVTPGEVFVLPTGVFAGVFGDATRLPLLFEACAPGSGHLEIVILREESGEFDEIATGGGVWFEFKDIADFYEHWSVGNDSGAAPDAVAERLTPFAYGPNSVEEQKYILFVHGWNMERWEKERYAETAFKRLYWQGYRGRFGLFSWPCTYGFGSLVSVVLDGSNFDRGEFSAWRSAQPLERLMQRIFSDYGGEFYVLSHSMGGIVVSEALRLRSEVGGGPITKVYVASQAAVSAHTFDGALSDVEGSATGIDFFAMREWIVGRWDYGPSTPNIYRDWFGNLIGGGNLVAAAGAIVNFYNENDWALAADNWQFNQITKPDGQDLPKQIWDYRYSGEPEVLKDAFAKTGASGRVLIPLHLGSRTEPLDRYEIMSFAAESRVKALGATPGQTMGTTRQVDLHGDVWPPGTFGSLSSHKWHSGEFRSSIQRRSEYWKTLLGARGFSISVATP